MACSNYQRERCVAAEMEACWQPTNPRSSLPYDSENDPFCPLAVARKFNQLQRRASLTGGTNSLIDLRQPAAKKATAERRSSRRPRSSGGRMTATPAALPCLAGAALQHKDGGGILAVRQPPLRASKGLPSSAQLDEGFARRRANERKLAAKANTAKNAGKGGGTDEGAPKTAELGAAAREEFVVKVSRRDDILQDVWLKMHSAESFRQAQGGGDLSQLLMLYRSASLEVIEGMMRYPELEKVVDGYTRKKGDGMRSYREAVAQDADFADATEAATWLGFSSRRNPLFLPPKAVSNAKKTPSSAVDFDSDLLARLRNAQDFILLDALTSSPGKSEAPADGIGSAPTATDFSGATLHGDGGSGSGGGGPRRPTIRDRVRAMNSQLATSQERIGELEDTLRSLEAGRDSDREKAARARGAAAEAGKRKMTQKMYRLRGNAAFLEEGLAGLEGEITAVRVRLFAERLDVARKRMLKDALTTEMSAKSKARRRRAKKRNPSPKPNRPPTRNVVKAVPDDEDRSASTIQARVRGMQARRLDKQTLDVSDSTPGREEKRRSGSHQEEAAAVRIEAAARGHLARKRAGEGLAHEHRGLETKEVGEDKMASGAMAASGVERQQENEGTTAASRTPTVTSAPAGAEEEATAVVVATASAVSDGLAQVEALGVVGVRAFFDSLGLGGCTNRLRKGSGGIDGTELARIAHAPNPDAELLAAGVSARLHRVKLLSALGVSVGAAGVGMPPIPPALDEDVPGGGGGGGLARVTAIAALHMVRQLRTEQDLVAGVLCKGSGATPNRSRVELGQDLPPQAEDRGTWDACDGASAGPKETVVGAGAAAPRGKGVCFASLVLPELEELLSTQLQLSSQARELLQQYTKGTGADTGGPTSATIGSATIATG